MELYVNAKSKKQINERLAADAEVWGYNFSMFGGGGQYMLDGTLPHGTVIKVYSKVVMGSPYAKAYGTWDANKGRVK